MNRLIYFGPPGTGKTHTLLQRMEEALRRGVPIERIAFLTFTRRARHEAVQRVEEALGHKVESLPYFRTIHSMAFRALKLGEGDVMGRKQLAEFGELMGLTFGDQAASEQAAEGITSASAGDHLLAIDNLARLRGVDPLQVWRDANSPHDRNVVDQFVRSYAVFKQERGLLDFTDVLLEYTRSGLSLPVDVVFVDEAQDLSALQWRVVLQAGAEAQQQYVAGDDDQAIYRWAGAQVEVFQELDGTREVLAQSHRLPRAVHACASRILARIKHRVPKQFEPRDAEGAVYRHALAQALEVQPGQQWLWLVRNRYLLPELRGLLQQRAVVYAQHGASSVYPGERDAIYSWEALRKGKAITVPEARDLYAKLRAREQVKHGHKLLPNVVDEEARLTLADLQRDHGLLAQGAWFDVFTSVPLERRAYYRALLRRHKTLRVEPQVVLETVHGAKGAQADHVALFMDQSRRTWEEGRRQPDEEHRVWYVGATRAREALHVISGKTQYTYPLPVAK